MPDGSDRFDGSLNEHAHVVCTHCGTVKDIDVSLEPDFADMVFEQTGYIMISSQLLIIGICESCIENGVVAE